VRENLRDEAKPRSTNERKSISEKIFRKEVKAPKHSKIIAEVKKAGRK
jgi:hypothetical protein